MFNFLFVTTKWFSKDGGIQTVNRKLCKEVAKNNFVCTLALDDFSDEEKNDACQHGVELISLVELQEKISNKEFDIVCTHSSFTGKYISKIKKLCENQKIPKFIHFLHHDPEEVENYKEYISETEITRKVKREEEVEYACQADWVIAIGEKLREAYKSDISGKNPTLIGKRKYLNLGIEKDDSRIFEITKAPRILLSGRTSSLYVKGIDIFSQAIGKINLNDYDIKCSIRGEDGNLDILSKMLKEKYKAPDNIQILPFTTDDKELEMDKKRTTLAVLPSREDGFGLSATETISSLIPTIVSDKSGIGKLIKTLSIDKKFKEQYVWKFGNDSASIDDLKNKMIYCIENQESAYLDTKIIREALLKVSSWEGAAKQFRKYCEEIFNIELMRDEKEEISLFMKRKGPYLKLYDISLLDAKKNIDMLSITFGKLRSKQGDLILKKAEQFRVRIALLDPCFPIPDENSSIASVREKEESMNRGDIRKDISAWYKDIWKKRGNNSKLEIRLFKALPTVNMIVADDKMFIGTFLLNKNDISPTFIVEHNKEKSMGYNIFDAHIDHFEVLWDNARPFEDIKDEEINAWELGIIYNDL